jgi:hypothetical protein
MTVIKGFTVFRTITLAGFIIITAILLGINIKNTIILFKTYFKKENAKMLKQEKEILWQDRKRTWCGFPVFTMYTLDEDKLYIDKGVFTTVSDEVRLYRILDISLTRTLLQKLFGLGTIHITSSDKNQGNFDLINIRDSIELRRKISDLVEKARNDKHVTMREVSDDCEEGEN